MQPTSRYFRWILVASLAMVLVSGGFCTHQAKATCAAGDTSRHYAAKKCCCGANCKCGAACPGRSAPDKNRQPVKTTDRDLRDLAKAIAGVSDVICDDPLAQRFSKPISTFCGDCHALQTLIAKHTCLQV